MAFEGVVALDGVDLALHRGEILGLIGPNGAGKTTLLNVMSGFVKPMPGRVLVTGVDVTRWEPDARVRQGIARSFQGVRLFNDLTVAENLEVPALALGLSRRATTEYAESLLQRTNLGSRSAARAGSLSAGDQHRVGVLRALALKPAFLLLDEPAAGLNEVESDELVVLIRAIRDELGCGVLVVDHDMQVIMPLCERIQVLNYGRTICIGDPATVRSDKNVIDAYLGSSDEPASA